MPNIELIKNRLRIIEHEMCQLRELRVAGSLIFEYSLISDSLIDRSDDKVRNDQLKSSATKHLRILYDSCFALHYTLSKLVARINEAVGKSSYDHDNGVHINGTLLVDFGYLGSSTVSNWMLGSTLFNRSRSRIKTVSSFLDRLRRFAYRQACLVRQLRSDLAKGFYATEAQNTGTYSDRETVISWLNVVNEEMDAISNASAQVLSDPSVRCVNKLSSNLIEAMTVLVIMPVVCTLFIQYCAYDSRRGLSLYDIHETINEIYSVGCDCEKDLLDTI